MARLAVMMLCRSGTVYMPTDSSYAHNMHVVTVTGHDDLDEAEQQARAMRPIGFNREGVLVWIVPWEDRFNPYLCPRAAAQWILR